MASWLHHVRRLNQRNVAAIRDSPLAEISGAFGDLGTLLPLMIALAVKGYIDLASTLVFSGLFNVFTGVLFGIPLPVQPMKAIAAAAISSKENLSAGTVPAAGQWVAVGVLLLTVTGLLRLAVAVVPVPVVKGIQLGAGLSLVLGAGSSLLQPLHWVHPALDNRFWALAAFSALILTQRMPRFPFALSVFALALLLAAVQVLLTSGRSHQGLPSFDVWRPRFALPTWIGFGDAPALWMAVGQLPLTTLNSIIAVSALAGELLPDSPTPSVTSIGWSVALMNLTGTWFGGMPVCHGAGGLAAQYRFGARSGASIILLGALKMLVGSLFGRTLVDLLASYPSGLLGVMVLASGLELAKVGNTLNQGAPDLWESVGAGQDQQHSHMDLDISNMVNKRHRVLSEEERQERWTVMLMTTACILAFRNDAVGFCAGWLCHFAYRLSHRWAERGRRLLGWGERAPLLRSR